MPILWSRILPLLLIFYKNNFTNLPVSITFTACKTYIFYLHKDVLTIEHDLHPLPFHNSRKTASMAISTLSHIIVILFALMWLYWSILSGTCHPPVPTPITPCLSCLTICGNATTDHHPYGTPLCSTRITRIHWVVWLSLIASPSDRGLPDYASSLALMGSHYRFMVMTPSLLGSLPTAALKSLDALVMS